MFEGIPEVIRHVELENAIAEVISEERLPNGHHVEHQAVREINVDEDAVLDPQNSRLGFHPELLLIFFSSWEQFFQPQQQLLAFRMVVEQKAKSL